MNNVSEKQHSLIRTRLIYNAMHAFKYASVLPFKFGSQSVIASQLTSSTVYYAVKELTASLSYNPRQLCLSQLS
jgi:hypothetical protein